MNKHKVFSISDSFTPKETVYFLPKIWFYHGINHRVLLLNIDTNTHLCFSSKKQLVHCPELYYYDTWVHRLHVQAVIFAVLISSIIVFKEKSTNKKLIDDFTIGPKN